MAYKISNYSKRKAKKLGVVIKPSKEQLKHEDDYIKLDIIKIEIKKALNLILRISYYGKI